MDALTIILLLIGAAVVLYHYWVKRYNYWIDRGITCLRPKFPFGNTKEMVLGKLFMAQFLQDVYRKFPDSKYVGIINVSTPQLVIRDPELLKHIMSKDFKHFVDRTKLLLDEKDEPLNHHLFNMSGEKWKNMRAKLTPTFTSGKMKLMFFLMKSCADHLKDSLGKYAETNQVISIGDFMGRYTTAVIATCAFGLEINSIENPDSDFINISQLFFLQTKSQRLRSYLRYIMPQAIKLFKMKVLDKKIETFFTAVVKDTVEFREKNNIQRNDFLDLLMQIKNKECLDGGGKSQQHNESKVEMDLNTMTAQCLLFFAAGFETSSLTLSYTLYELALQPQIQQKLQSEIDRVLMEHNGEVTYEALQQMAYMDKVVSETLRLYPPLPTLIRQCTAKYRIPDTDHIIEEGMRIIIPMFAIQRDAKYFPDPDKYNPDNFNEDRVKERHHFAYFPFGEGPRICLGLRFGLMQVKMGLTTLLSKYSMSAVEQTPVPIQFDPKAMSTNPESPILLQISLRNC